MTHSARIESAKEIFEGLGMYFNGRVLACLVMHGLGVQSQDCKLTYRREFFEFYS